MTRRHFIGLAFVAVALVGCAGNGTNFVASFKPSAIPRARVAFTRTYGLTGIEVVSMAPDGSGETVHARLPEAYDVWDCDASGSTLLLTMDGPGGSMGVFTVSITSGAPVALTPTAFEDVTSARYSRDYAKVVVSGTLNGGTPVVWVANADGSGGSMVYDDAMLAIYASSGQLAIGGVGTDALQTPFVGAMSIDGTTISKLVNRIEPIELDELGGTVVYSASVGGDASGVTALYSVPIGGGTPTALYSGPKTIDSDPRIADDGSKVYFIRDGVGIFTTPLAGGTPTLANSDVNALRILRAR